MAISDKKVSNAGLLGCNSKGLLDEDFLREEKEKNDTRKEVMTGTKKYMKRHDRFACPMSGCNFGKDPNKPVRAQSTLTNHFHKVHGRKEFRSYVGKHVCDIDGCSKTYTQSQNLRKHKIKVHKMKYPKRKLQEKNIVTPFEGKKTYKCIACKPCVLKSMKLLKNCLDAQRSTRCRNCVWRGKNGNSSKKACYYSMCESVRKKNGGKYLESEINYEILKLEFKQGFHENRDALDLVQKQAPQQEGEVEEVEPVHFAFVSTSDNNSNGGKEHGEEEEGGVDADVEKVDDANESVNISASGNDCNEEYITPEDQYITPEEAVDSGTDDEEFHGFPDMPNIEAKIFRIRNLRKKERDQLNTSIIKFKNDCLDFVDSEKLEDYEKPEETATAKRKREREERIEQRKKLNAYDDEMCYDKFSIILGQ